MTTGITKYTPGTPAEFIEWAPIVPNPRTDRRAALLMDTLCKGANQEEFELFCAIANQFRLNVFTEPRPMWLLSYDSREPKRPQFGIAAYRIFAERSGRYGGSTEPEWAGIPKDPDADIRWRSAWLYEGNPGAARVGVYVRGNVAPAWGIALWKEYAKYTTDFKTKETRLRSLWATYPSMMIAKCAEKQALVKAFPEQLAEAEALHLFSAEADGPMSRREANGLLYPPEASQPERRAPRTTVVEVPAEAPPQSRSEPKPEGQAYGKEPWTAFWAYSREQGIAADEIARLFDGPPSKWVATGHTWDEALAKVKGHATRNDSPEEPEGDVTSPSTEAHSLSAEACPGCGAASWTGQFCESCGFSLSDTPPVAPEQPELMGAGSNAYPREERKAGRR